MIKFIKVAFKKDMINVVDNTIPTWYDCDPKAKGFAKITFKEGDDVELVMEQRNNKPFITQVRRIGPATCNQNGTGTQHPSLPPSEPGQPAENVVPPVAPVVPPVAPVVPPVAPARPAYGQKSPEESEKITRLSVLSSAANAAQVMTGQITDSNVLGDVVIGLYTRFLAEIKK